MPSTYPAMKARMGDTDYFILSMKARELMDKVKIFKGLDENMPIEESYRRPVNYDRVKTEIAPYLANDESRFFGAVILSALNLDADNCFQPLPEALPEAAKDLPRPYNSMAFSIGFLTFSGGEVLKSLDGQHRIQAIKFAVTGRDEKGNDIPGIKPCAQLAHDDITVILVKDDPRKSRKIVTGVNRYAKSTTKSESIVTDDDDISAVLAREVADKLIGARLVKIVKNVLTPGDREFTTLAIVYECNKAILADYFPDEELKKDKLPSPERSGIYRNKVMKVWGALLRGIDVFADAVSTPGSKGDKGRKEIRKHNLLGRPVAQEALVKAFVRLTLPPTAFSPDDAIGRLNRLPWSITPENLETWQRVLWNGGTDGRVNTTDRPFSAGLIYYLAGGKLSGVEEGALLKEYRQKFPDDEREGKQLPPVPAGNR